MRRLLSAVFVAGMVMVPAWAEFTRESALASILETHPGARQPVADPASYRDQGEMVYKRLGDTALTFRFIGPVTGERTPCLVWVHGGGWESGDAMMELPLAAEMAKRGYASALVTYRLGEEGRFPNAVLDVAAAVAYLRSHSSLFSIDPERLVVCGASAGGQLASWVGAANGRAEVDGVVFPEKVRLWAVVNIDGLVDFTDRALIAQQEVKPSAPTRYLGATFAASPRLWKRASPYFQVSASSAPVLFLDSTAPTPLLPGREQMTESLKAYGIRAELVTFPETPHTFWLFEPWQSQVAAEIDRFLQSLPSNPSSSTPQT